jgi:hypothetical protein
MCSKHSTVSRRAFIKLTVQLLGSIVYLRTCQVTSTKPDPGLPQAMVQEPGTQQIGIQPRPYGAGLYGQGVYPEYHVSLPQVTKE